MKEDITGLKQDIEALRTWTRTHDRAHVADDERLTLLLEALNNHDSNHHGAKSRIKENGLTAILIAIMAILGEAMGLWELVRQLPLPL